jgi:ubiquinone/menaquinone biosynthesis C-methylase UbiE
MVKAVKREEKIVAKNYKMVIIETLMERGNASGMELAEKIQMEIPFLGAESAYKVKAEYVVPTLEKSQCFVKKDADLWGLSEVFLNLENHAHQLLKKALYPMTIEAIRISLAEKHKDLSPEDIPLNLDNDERFYNVELSGKSYVFLREWDFCNRYALAVFVENGNKKGYSHQELVDRLAHDYRKKPTNVILMLDEDAHHFRMGVDCKYTAFPRSLKRLKIHDVPKNVLDTICDRLEGHRAKALSLHELSDELLGQPLALTKLINDLNDDPRFIVDGGKVRRSKQSLEEIETEKKEKRRKLNAERKLQREAEKAKKAQEAGEEVERVKKSRKIRKSADDVDGQKEEAVAPVVDEVAMAEEKDLLVEESVSVALDAVPEEVPSSPDVAPDLMEEALAEEAAPEPEPVPVPEKRPQVDKGVVRKKAPIIRKFVRDDEPPFDVEATGVDMEELSAFLRELVELDGMMPGLTPTRFDDLLRQCLSLRVPDYKVTNPCVADFMVQLARPRLDHIVVDLVCGRGDLLLRVLQHVRASLRKDNQQDKEMFTAFCDEQLVGFDISEFLIRAARLLLKLNGFDVSLLDVGNSLDEQEMLIDEMFSIIFGDFSNFNNREMKGFVAVMKRLLQKDGRAVFLFNDELLAEDSEVSQAIADSFHLLHRITFTDYEGIRKSVVHIAKGRRMDVRSKVCEIDSPEGLSRIIDIML